VRAAPQWAHSAVSPKSRAHDGHGCDCTASAGADGAGDSGGANGLTLESGWAHVDGAGESSTVVATDAGATDGTGAAGAWPPGMNVSASEPHRIA